MNTPAGNQTGSSLPPRVGRRLRLPVAPRAQTGSRLAPATPARPAMVPEEALAWLTARMAHDEKIAAVEVGGPGDPLAMAERSLRTLRLVRQRYPELPLALATIGLGGDRHASLLAELGVSEVFMYVDAVEQSVAAKLYGWVRPGTQTLPLPQAITLLIREQAQAVLAFVYAGLAVTVATTVYPGINDDHVAQLAETMAGLGAEAICLRFFNSAEPEGEPAAGVEEALRARVRGVAGRYLPVKEWPEVEEPGEPSPGAGPGSPVDLGAPAPTSTRPNVAVASATGMEIDLHLGQAQQLLIYGPRADGLLCLLGSRALPAASTGSGRWENLAALLPDCFAILAAQAGANPRAILTQLGLRVLLVEGGVAATVDRLYGGRKRRNGVK